jgi:beta-N-acetylhexosaminidase
MLSLEEKIGQMCMVGFEGLTAPDHILDWLKAGRIGGVILFARNVESPEQVAKLCQQCHEAAKYPILIGIDQEGGAVARLREKFTESAGAMALAASGDSDLTERISKVLALEMQALGINWTYAPVLDISYNAQNPTVGTRSFGSTAEGVAEFGAAAVRGFQSGGVAATAKHFPGLGNTAVDTHQALAVVNTSLTQMLEEDLLPYREAIAAGLASVMTTHTIFPALDKDLPATLSPIIVKKILREELGFSGIVTTDCMEMKAISNHHGSAESAVLAALAGIDIILFSHTLQRQADAYEGLVAAAKSGRLPESVIDAANERIAKLKEQFPAQSPNPELIRNPEHLAIAQEAARKGMVNVKSTTLPLEGKLGLIEFASYLESEVVEKGGQTGLEVLARQAMSIETVALKTLNPSESSLERARHIAQNSDWLIIATRNAHLFEAQLTMALEFASLGKQVFHICLRNPYDAGRIPARAIWATCGDSTASLEAVIAALLGEFTPAGTLPVSLEA